MFEVIVNKEKLKAVLEAMMHYTVEDPGEILMEMSKKGIRFMSVNDTSTTMMTIFLSKKFFTNYSCKKDLTHNLDTTDFDSILNMCKKTEEKITDLEMIIEKNEIRIHCGNINTKLVVGTREVDMMEGSKKTVKNVHEKSIKIGEMPIEVLRDFLKAAATFKGDQNRFTTISKKKDEKFTMEAEIETGDTVEIPLDKVLKNATDEDFKVMLMADELNAGAKRIIKILGLKNILLEEKLQSLKERKKNKIIEDTEYQKELKKINKQLADLGTVMMYGGSELPMMITMTDTKPEDADKYKNELEFYWLLAPRIEMED